MREFPFGLPWGFAKLLVGQRRFRAHMRRLATVHLCIGRGGLYYVDGYGNA